MKILFAHVGIEQDNYPEPFVKALCEKLVSNSVFDVIICCHALQGDSISEQGQIFYGLGNFLIPEGQYDDGKIIHTSNSDFGAYVEISEVNGEIVIAKKYYSITELGRHIDFPTGGDLKQLNNIVEHYSEPLKMDTKLYVDWYSHNIHKLYISKLVKFEFLQQANMKMKLKLHHLVMYIYLFGGKMKRRLGL